MPVLEAISRLCGEDETRAAAEIVSHHAPTWAGQMPALHGSDNGKSRPGARGGTQDRMLREMVEALEALASRQPLVLILEDIHWSDPSTIDLITRLAMRTDSTQLMIVASFRTSDLKPRVFPSHAPVIMDYDVEL